jgi:DNA-cytosine methyltransferase
MFDYAAEKAGYKNIFQVEINEFCQKLLNVRYPETDKYLDIKEFDGTKYRGLIDVISGGFPCQPFSQAGQRKGREDERALFPEALRVIREVSPEWLLLENVYGLLNIHDGDYFQNEIVASLENEGYSVQPYIIPASAIGAIHRRDRIWIIGYSKSAGKTTQREVFAERTGDKEGSNSKRSNRFNESGASKNSKQIRCNGSEWKEKSDIGKFGKFSSGNESGVSDKVIANDESRINGGHNRESEKRQESEFGKGFSDGITTNPEETKCKFGRIARTRGNGFTNTNFTTTHTDITRQSGQGVDRRPVHSEKSGIREEYRFINDSQFQREWIEVANQICGMDAAPSTGLHKSRYRKQRLEGLGNGIQWEIAWTFFELIKEFSN